MFSCPEWVWSELDMENSVQSQGSSSKAGVNTRTPDDGMLPALDGLDTTAVTGSLLIYVCVLGLHHRIEHDTGEKNIKLPSATDLLSS